MDGAAHDVAQRRRSRLIEAALIAVVLCGGALLPTHGRARYLARASLVFVYPSHSFATSPSGNPSIFVTADLERRELSSPQARARLRASGMTGNYTLRISGTGTSAPVMEVTATDTTPRRAVHDAQQILAQVRTVLAGRQDQVGVLPPNRIDVVVVSPPRVATRIK